MYGSIALFTHPIGHLVRVRVGDGMVDAIGRAASYLNIASHLYLLGLEGGLSTLADPHAPFIQGSGLSQRGRRWQLGCFRYAIVRWV